MHLTLRSGHRHQLADPDSAGLTAEDVAAGLSRLCRFSGHSAEFYSVAQHSLLVAWLAQRDLFAGDVQPPALLPEDHRRILLAALLHDAHETLWGWGDIARPALQAAPSQVRLWIEQHRTRHDAAVARAFGLAPCLFAHPAVRRADNLALAWEFRDVVDPPRTAEADLPVPSPARLDPIDSYQARHLWLRSLRDVSAGDPLPDPWFLSPVP